MRGEASTPMTCVARERSAPSRRPAPVPRIGDDGPGPDAGEQRSDHVDTVTTGSFGGPFGADGLRAGTVEEAAGALGPGFEDLMQAAARISDRPPAHGCRTKRAKGLERRWKAKRPIGSRRGGLPGGSSSSPASDQDLQVVRGRRLPEAEDLLNLADVERAIRAAAGRAPAAWGQRGRAGRGCSRAVSQVTVYRRIKICRCVSGECSATALRAVRRNACSPAPLGSAPISHRATEPHDGSPGSAAGCPW